MIDLSVSRDNIDRIDAQIVSLFEERMKIANDVAAYKLETGKAVYDPEREMAKLDRLSTMSHGEFNERAVRELFTQIMSISRKYQYSVLPMKDAVTSYEKVDSIEFSESDRVCYFGVPGTYTQAAMEAVFGMGVNGMNDPSFRGVMEAVQSGRADYGVLPIENSSTGGITANYDLLLEYDNAIVGQYVLEIDQCLIGCEGADVSGIEKVYSHPQGLSQCATFLEKHPHIKAIECESTAAGAKKVAEDKDPSQAAIAGARAAREYSLSVLVPDIQTQRDNKTRFIILGPKEIYTDKSDKINLCIELPHTSGSLYRILSHFLYNGLNMTQIESRPIPEKTWEYRFFIDVEGNLDDAAMRNALRGIAQEAAFMRVLGNHE